jgi:ligand-binding sensor domain-containing protein
MSAGGVLFVDTDAGLYRREQGGFVPVRERPAALPPGSAHVTALAWLGDRLVAGFFDAGLAVADVAGGRLAWTPVEGSSAWGVNALLSAGGVIYIASLRGAARFDGRRLTPLEGPGAAFSLAATADGIAIGYAQGVLLPGARLLSAFHGLPGNQALALAAGPELAVGMPSGLAGVAARRVAWRVSAGEGKLPHPWVTALLRTGDRLYVGTNGGGVVRRAGDGRYEPYVETEGLKVSAGCLTLAGGRVYAGTDGRGLWRLSADGSRFEPLKADLPSPRVTALLASADALLIGTDEGLARMPLARGAGPDGAAGAAP